MTNQTTPSPANIFCPGVGHLQSLERLPSHGREFMENRIIGGEVRCFWHNGTGYIHVDDLEPYSPSGSEPFSADSSCPIVLKTDGGAPAPLADAIVDSLRELRAKLPTLTREKLARSPNSPQENNPFVQAAIWGGFWSDVARVAANFANEAEAARIKTAHSIVVTGLADGTANTLGIPNFHKELLSLANPELEDLFAEIWKPGRACLELPEDAEAQKDAVAFLGCLTAMFSGYRGEPEGSDTPQHTMGRYLELMTFKLPGPTSDEAPLAPPESPVRELPIPSCLESQLFNPARS